MPSLKASLSILKCFSDVSGLSLNCSKTEILKIGDQIPGEKICNIKTIDKACSLGIWYFDNMRDTIQYNHTTRLEKFSMTLNKWKACNLSLFGKTTILKSVAFPKLTHIIANLETPHWFVEEAQKMIFNFIWDNKPPRIKNNVIINLPRKVVLKSLMWTPSLGRKKLYGSNECY